MDEISKFKLEQERIDLLYSLYPDNENIKRMKKAQTGIEFNMSDDDISDLFEFIDDAIIFKGMVNQDYLNDTGIKLQLIYDNLYAQLN